ncbi:uncharacterized protein Z518_02424 [Rhinocladiella mackenziei CBS 650.93]|uniref:Actin-like ATPase domain-containing protein n=1 Tax=Rhinocladiella mackenziei CBS 650.93 TaxID=1442369 RepID=A0A0D2JEZ6_9EURO|nr:uncharacterized protein Z518_02424 [Rhinocladiella mackenziei CBS 650.93]KIX07770.1 hypothetical protein Z518_02424 [Rhinocladiella mackenziei CBS 650.93]
MTRAKIFICLDCGTAYCKAAFRVFLYIDGQQPMMCRDHLIASLQPVVWPNSQCHVLTQIAYARSPNSARQQYEQLWGPQVSEALKRQEIRREDVFKDLKPVLFGQGEREMIHVRHKITGMRLAGKIPSRGTKFDKLANHVYIDSLELYSDFMGHAYRYILHRISEDCRQLGWPDYHASNQYRDFTPPQDIEVALPLPVNCTPEQVQLVLMAARWAGIPNAYPVAEPAAALAHHLQTAFETAGYVSTSTRTLILDIGAGSADLQGWSVLSTKPLIVRELIPGLTFWCGGNQVNRQCGILISNSIRPWDQVLHTLACKERRMSKEDVIRALEDKFEMAKSSFSGSEQCNLKLRGLPNLPAFKLKGGDRVVLEPEDVREIFRPTLGTILNNIKDAIKVAQENGNDRVDEILMVGGGSSSRYLRDQISSACEKDAQPLAGYPIPVRSPSDATAPFSTTVAFGSLLLLTDKTFIKERVVSRGYCVAWDKEVRDLDRGLYPEEPVVRDPHDGVQRVLKVSKFFIRPQEVVPQNYSVSHRGWRAFLEEDCEDGGWILDEDLYFSETVATDDEPVENPLVDIHPMPSPLKFFIPVAGCQQFETHLSPEGKRYLYAEYEVGLVLRGIIMTFELVIPRTGKFSRQGNGYGENPLRWEGPYLGFPLVHYSK